MSVKIIQPMDPMDDAGFGADIVAPLGMSTYALRDNDDATYLRGSPVFGGILGATMALEPLPSYDPGDPITLHIRLSAQATDPGTGAPDGHGEVFIATTGGAGNVEIAGFSDGSISGFGFHFVDDGAGSPVDLIVPLNLSAWGPITDADVAAALMAGAYIDFNYIRNDNSGTATTGDQVKVYEAAIWVGQVNRRVPERRKYPNPTGRGLGPRRHWPPPRRGVTGIN